MGAIKNWFLNLMTEPDNKTHCPARWCGILGFVYAIAIHAYTTIINHIPFDLTSFGTGYAAMMATLGIALGLKKDTKSKEDTEK